MEYLSSIILLTSGSLDFTSTGVKWKFPHLTSLRIKRWGIVLNAAPGDTGTIQLRKINQAGTATVLGTIELLTTHTTDDTVYQELMSGSSATPIVAGNEVLDINASASAASVSACYVVVEVSIEPSQVNSSMTATT